MKKKRKSKTYDKALEIKPDFARAWKNKGVSLEKLGKKEEDTKCYENAKKMKS